MAKITDVACYVLDEEKVVLTNIEARLHQLFQMVDAIAECQRREGHHHMGETMRRVRGVDAPKSPRDQMQALSIAFEQVLYACMKSGFPIHKIFNVAFGRLQIRIEEEGMNRKLESDLIDDVLRNLAASQMEVDSGE